MKKRDIERLQTDEALRTERDEADKTYGDREARLRGDADATVERARGRADAVLAGARARADLRLDDAGRAIAVRERAQEDDALRLERATADLELAGEREEHARVLAELLRSERAQTDRYLGSEREQSDAAIATRDDYLGMVAHDIRALLGAMAFSAATLELVPCEGEARERVQGEAARLQRLTARMTQLVGDLLDVVRIEAGKLRIDVAPHDASHLVRETLETFAPVARKRGIALTGPAPSQPTIVDLDRERILQVLANIVSNAIKFAHDGGTVSIAIEPDGDELRFSLSDDGPGVPPDQVEAIFERYGQVARYDRRGLGLGLYIAKRIVEAHGGRIWVESRPGAAGSTFSFTVPRTRRGA